MQALDNMKYAAARFLAPLTLAVTLSGCAGSCEADSTNNVDFDPTDVQYSIDPRTGVCYGTVGVVKGWTTNAGMTTSCVPCTAEVQKLVDQDDLKKTLENKIKPVTCTP